MTITELEQLFEDARNQGRHEGIVTFFDELEKVLNHGSDVRRWYESARAIYEEHRPA